MFDIKRANREGLQNLPWYIRLVGYVSGVTESVVESEDEWDLIGELTERLIAASIYRVLFYFILGFLFAHHV